MTRGKLIGLWLAAALLFALAVIYLPRSWQFVGEGSYLLVNLTYLWAVIILGPPIYITARWLRRRK